MESTRQLRDYSYLTGYTPSTCIQLPKIPAQQYEIDPDIIQMLPLFYGDLHEDPYKHLDDFLEICSTVKIQDLPDDALRLILFPFSLKDRAKYWLRTIGRPITTWIDLQQEFLKKYFSIGRTNAFRRAIIGFSQLPEEQFHESWERLQELLRRCRHHDLPKWQVVQSFYEGLTEFNRQLVDMSCGYGLMSKSEDEAYSLFEILSENSSNHASLPLHNSVTQSESKEIFEHPHSIDLNSRVNMDFFAPKTNISSPTHQESCTFCASPAHHVGMCPAVAQLPPAIQAQVLAAHEAPPSPDFSNIGWEQSPSSRWKSHRAQDHYPSMQNFQNWAPIPNNSQNHTDSGGQPICLLPSYSPPQSPCFQSATPHSQSYNSQPTFQRIDKDDSLLPLPQLVLAPQHFSPKLVDQTGKFFEESIEEESGCLHHEPLKSLINPSPDACRYIEPHISLEATRLELTHDMSKSSWGVLEEVHCSEEVDDTDMHQVGNLDVFEAEDHDESQAIVINDACGQIEEKELHEGINAHPENSLSETFELIEGIDIMMDKNDSIMSCDAVNSNSSNGLNDDGSAGDSIKSMECSSHEELNPTEAFEKSDPLELKPIIGAFQFMDLSLKHLCDDFMDPFWVVDTYPSSSKFFVNVLPLPCYYLRKFLQPTCAKTHKLVFEPAGIG